MPKIYLLISLGVFAVQAKAAGLPLHVRDPKNAPILFAIAEACRDVPIGRGSAKQSNDSLWLHESEETEKLAFNLYAHAARVSWPARARMMECLIDGCGTISDTRRARSFAEAIVKKGQSNPSYWPATMRLGQMMSFAQGYPLDHATIAAGNDLLGEAGCQKKDINVCNLACIYLVASLVLKPEDEETVRAIRQQNEKRRAINSVPTYRAPFEAFMLARSLYYWQWPLTTKAIDQDQFDEHIKLANVLPRTPRLIANALCIDILQNTRKDSYELPNILANQSIALRVRTIGYEYLLRLMAAEEQVPSQLLPNISAVQDNNLIFEQLMPLIMEILLEHPSIFIPRLGWPERQGQIYRIEDICDGFPKLKTISSENRLFLALAAARLYASDRLAWVYPNHIEVAISVLNAVLEFDGFMEFAVFCEMYPYTESVGKWGDLSNFVYYLDPEVHAMSQNLLEAVLRLRAKYKAKLNGLEKGSNECAI